MRVHKLEPSIYYKLSDWYSESILDPMKGVELRIPHCTSNSVMVEMWLMRLDM